MWLSGHQTPNFRTINRFRSERMKDVIYETFFSIVDLLRQERLVKLEDYFLYGTKIEANTNHTTLFGANQRKSTIRSWRRNSEKSLPRSNRWQKKMKRRNKKEISKKSWRLHRPRRKNRSRDRTSGRALKESSEEPHVKESQTGNWDKISPSQEEI